ncbi:MAG TPA: DUF2079 domain-containing protein [Candidatus Saccharimonadales bacterium]|nr:DUF2079 domain-containing protein [Candidatus Saccharimonadales bacterium]
MNNRFISIAKYLIGWPFSILSLIFIIRLISPKLPEILSNIKNINITFLFYALGLFLGFYFLRSYIWYRLVKFKFEKISFKESCYFWSISELKRYIPGNIWSFVGRTVIFSDLTGLKKKEIGKLLVLEASSFVLGAAIFSLLSLPFIADYFVHQLSFLYQVIISVAICFIALSYIYHYKFLGFFSDSHPVENLSIVLMSIISVSLFGFAHYFTISAFIPLNIQLFFQLSGFFVLAWLIGYLSVLTPAGFGVREGIIIGGLSKFLTGTTSAFAALFSRIILIISELIFVALTYLLYKIKNKKIDKVENWMGENLHLVILTLAFIVYVIYFSTASFARYDNFYTGRFDLGNMAQTVWNTSHGRIFQFTNPDGTDVISRLGFHADFLLIFLAPFYLIWPNPKMLLLIQAFIAGGGCYFVYLIAKDILRNKNIAFALSLSFLLNPSVQRANLYEFHAVTLVTTLLLATYYFYMKKKYMPFILFALLSAITKEEIWVIIALFGPALFFQQKKKVMGILFFLSGIAVFYYLVSYAIPHAHGAKHFALSYYSDFGDSTAEVVKTIILSPQKVIGIVLQPSRLTYLKQLFMPLGYLSVFSPFYLVFALPELVINMLSNNSQFHQIYYQYTSAVTPFIFISAIYGIKRIKKIFSKISNTLLIAYIIFCSLLAAYLIGPLPGAKEANLDMFVRPVQDREFIDYYLSIIPKRLSVAASNNVGSHLSQRQKIYALPLGIDKADVIVFLLDEGSEFSSSLSTERSQVDKLRQDKNYKLVIDRDKFVVFRKRSI